MAIVRGMTDTLTKRTRFAVGQQIGLLSITIAVLSTKRDTFPAWLVVLLVVWQGLLLWQYYSIYRSKTRN